MPRLVLYNVEYGQGLSGRKTEYLKFWTRLFGTKSVIEQIGNALARLKPDIVGVTEIDTGTPRKQNQIRILQKWTGLPFFDTTVKYSSRGLYKAMLRIPIIRRQGNGILSKYSILNKQYISLRHGVKRIACVYTITIAGKKCNLILVHLALGRRARQKQIKQLAILQKNSEQQNIPLILMGDFNAKLSELSPLFELGLVNHPLSRQGITNQNEIGREGRAATYPAFKPKEVRDYVLTSRGINVASAKTVDWDFSDHLPIIVDFSLS